MGTIGEQCLTALFRLSNLGPFAKGSVKEVAGVEVVPDANKIKGKNV